MVLGCSRIFAACHAHGDRRQCLLWILLADGSSPGSSSPSASCPPSPLVSRPDQADSLGRRDSQKFRKLGISLEIINRFILSYRLLVSNFSPLLNSSEFSFPFTEAVRTTCWPLILWRSKSKKFSFLAAQTSPSLRRGPRPSRTSTASR